jgi:hypothetical protein
MFSSGLAECGIDVAGHAACVAEDIEGYASSSQVNRIAINTNR